MHAKNVMFCERFAKKPHSHSHCEIFIHVNGEMEIFVEKNFYKISEGSVRLYASGEFHFGKLDKKVPGERYQISVPKEFFEPVCKGNILKILYLANKSSIDSQKALFAGGNALTDILEVINRNSAKIYSVDDICRMTNYSASYINELFKKSMNITPYKFVVSKKLNQAKIALDSGVSVSNAAELAGFNNYSNFISLFGKTFGVTPKRYQQKRQNLNFENN